MNNSDKEKLTLSSAVKLLSIHCVPLHPGPWPAHNFENIHSRLHSPSRLPSLSRCTVHKLEGTGPEDKVLPGSIK